MKRLLLLGLIPIAVTAAAQTMDHSSMPGMVMPGDSQKPAKSSTKKPAPTQKAPAQKAASPGKAPTMAPMDHSSMPGMKMPAAKPAAQDHSSMPGMAMPPGKSMPGMDMPAQPQKSSSMPGMTMPAGQPAMPDHSSMPGMKMPAAGSGSMPGMTMPSGQAMPDHAAMPGMNMNSPGHDMASMGTAEIPHGPPPPPPQDRAADRFYAPAAMAAASTQLKTEHGGEAISKVMVSLAEYQVRDGKDGFRWEGQGWYGGDINRFVLKSEGEGTRGEGVESAELQGLYSRAIGVYTDAQVGIRQDFEPHSRSYATIGVQSMLPYWFDVEGALFLSTKGEFLGRLEGTYDLLLTNRLILQPRAELNFAAQNTAETRTGSGLSNAELGLRLRYEITREFAPYIGVSWDQQVGQTANYSRALGRDTGTTSFVFGVRTFF
jgi:copper resistance protein B